MAYLTNQLCLNHPPLQMLSRKDQESVTLALESRLASYFEGGDDHFWDGAGGGGSCSDHDDGEDADWLMADGHDRRGMGVGRGSFAWAGVGGGSGSGGMESFGVDASAAAAWLAGGGGAVYSSLLAES